MDSMIKHCGTQYLETERLVLRPFAMEDAEAMYRNWASDVEVTKYLTWPAHADLSTTKDVLKDWTENYARRDYYQWAIVLKEQGFEPIGSIGVVHHDDRTATAHVGYCIGQKWWHRGIAAEALRCMMDFLFEQIGMHRIEARHDSRNPNSGAVMKKCGMKYEGTLRKADWNNQGICDACYYSMLASER